MIFGRAVDAKTSNDRYVAYTKPGSRLFVLRGQASARIWAESKDVTNREQLGLDIAYIPTWVLLSRR